MEEMLLVNIANNNPAAQSYKELFDDSALIHTAYMDFISLLGNFLAKQPSMAGRGKGETLIEILVAPSKASPYSLEGQLQFLLDKWGALLGEDIIRRILRAIDFVREEVIRQHGGGDSHPIIEAPTYGGAYAEYERYSPDKEWMPRLVLIAKNSYVWLEQLSRKYKFWVKTLDQIPDEELDLLRIAASPACG